LFSASAALLYVFQRKKKYWCFSLNVPGIRNIYTSALLAVLALAAVAHAGDEAFIVNSLFGAFSLKMCRTP
jgi:hypothetical protein